MDSTVSTLFGDGFGVLIVDYNEQSLNDTARKLESYGYTGKHLHMNHFLVLSPCPYLRDDMVY